MLAIIPALQMKNPKLACYKIESNRIFAKGRINILGLVGHEVSVTTLNSTVLAWKQR